MNWNDLKLGKKIGGGFGLLIVIAMTLGGIAIASMMKVNSQSKTLSTEYVPNITVCTSALRNFGST
ncbi:MAG: hypothetical protein JXR40_11060 [Pontiellaceae bacterium]|nr:hypothetical protein [Pontiellaceae bacterium]